MKKHTFKAILGVFLAAIMILVSTLPCFAAQSDDAQESYPFIFCHGMMGWGEGAPMLDFMGPYWGGSEEAHIITYLEELGYDVYYPAVGGISSAWDRACELYAWLCGTVVDYGEAHSREHGHDRYGRDYTGKAIMGEPWDMESKINLIGHSFGGATIRLFTSLMAYGDEAEIAASGDDCSGLFKGGHADAINAVITLAAPHNGTIVANHANDLFVLGFIFTFVEHLMGVTGSTMMDPILDHWGLSAPNGSGEFVMLNLVKMMKFFNSKDQCFYDMTLRGAEEINKKIKTVDSVYYISYACRATTEGFLGLEWPKSGMFPFFYLTFGFISTSEGLTVDGYYMDKSWTVSDGIVPLNSALYPYSDADNTEPFPGAEKAEPGIWYTMPVMENYDHFDFCTSTRGFETVENYQAFYLDLVKMVNKLGK